MIALARAVGVEHERAGDVVIFFLLGAGHRGLSGSLAIWLL
jgi:hypothetical protein